MSSLEQTRRLFSAKLKRKRQQLGLTQKELSDMLNIKRSCLGAYEECRALPTLTKFINMCDILDVSPNEFLGYVEEKETM